MKKAGIGKMGPSLQAQPEDFGTVSTLERRSTSSLPQKFADRANFWLRTPGLGLHGGSARHARYSLGALLARAASRYASSCRSVGTVIVAPLTRSLYSTTRTFAIESNLIDGFAFNVAGLGAAGCWADGVSGRRTAPADRSTKGCVRGPTAVNIPTSRAGTSLTLNF